MKSLKIPKAEYSTAKNLTSAEMFFLDLLIMTDEVPGELYRRVFITNDTPISASRKAGAITNTPEAKTYLELRKRHLEKYYFPEENTVSDEKLQGLKGKSMEEVFVDLQPKFIEELYAIMQNRSDPNFSDTVKIFLTKALKDIQTDKAAIPPLRYLPESCSQCRYKLFVEDNTADECLRCKYREFGLKNGLNYDHKTQLNPTENEI